MDREQIIDALKTLAKGQGFYGRLLENMSDELLQHLEEQNFGDILDMVLYLEQ